MANIDLIGLFERNDFYELLEATRELEKSALNKSKFSETDFESLVGKEIWVTDYTRTSNAGYFTPTIDKAPVLMIIDPAFINEMKNIENDDRIADYLKEKAMIKALKKHSKQKAESGKFVKSGTSLMYTESNWNKLFDDEQLAWQHYILSKKRAFQDMTIIRDAIKEEEENFTKWVNEYK